MITLLLTLALIALTMLVMAVGVLVTGKRLRGSCGGSDCQCVAEGSDPKSCQRQAS